MNTLENTVTGVHRLKPSSQYVWASSVITVSRQTGAGSIHAGSGAHAICYLRRHTRIWATSPRRVGQSLVTQSTQTQHLKLYKFFFIFCYMFRSHILTFYILVQILWKDSIDFSNFYFPFLYYFLRE
jgi:hypothetical protein